jgi:glycine cleavage system transcriptional repressor
LVSDAGDGRHLAVWAVGSDRPGIVAGVSGVLLDAGANLEDTQMAILRGHFTMMLVVALPAQGDPDALRAGLERVAGELGLEAIALSELSGAEGAEAPEPTHLVTVYGADHPGIVHAVSTELAAAGVSITDLQSHLAEPGDDPSAAAVYAVMLEVAAGTPERVAEIEERLGRIAREQKLELSLRPLERDEL